jgi:hypothetical protein
MGESKTNRMKLRHTAALALVGWWKREVAMAGRRRVFVSVILFWGPIFLAVIALFVIWAAYRLT